MLVTKRPSQEIVLRSVKDIVSACPGPSSRDAHGSHMYQLILRRMQLLPCTTYIKKALHAKGRSVTSL